MEHTSKTWESVDFRRLVESFVFEDKRFEGMAQFVADIRFCWSYQIPTACAGHGFIFFNPDWFDKLPDQTHRTVIYHEAMHLIQRHLERGKFLDPYVHNQATDHVINLDAEDHGFTFEGWEGPCKDAEYRGMSSDQVYEILSKGVKYQNLNIDLKNHISREMIEQMIQDMLDGASFDEQKELAEIRIKEIPNGGIGDGEAGVGLQFDLMKQKVMMQEAEYPEILKDYMVEPDDVRRRSWRRPSRRVSDFMLPGRIRKKATGNRLAHLVYVLDVSGSISTAQGVQFNDSAQTIKKLLNPELMTVIFFDTKIQHEQTFTDKQDYSRIKVRAGGGTDLRPVYKRLRLLEPEAVIIFTDLCVDIPPEPKWDTIWLLPDANNAVPLDLYGKVYLCPKIEKKEKS